MVDRFGLIMGRGFGVTEGGYYCLHSDYEESQRQVVALTAERDEWQQRAQAMWRTIQLGVPLDREITEHMHDLDKQRWAAHVPSAEAAELIALFGGIHAPTNP